MRRLPLPGFAALLALALSLPAVAQTAAVAPGGDPVVGRFTVNVVARSRADDGYWDWLVGHLADLSRHRQLLTETRIQLSLLASEIDRAQAMRFNLARMHMEWLAAEDVSIEFAGVDLGRFFADAVTEVARAGPAARAANRRESARLGNDIRDWRALQEQLVDAAVASLAGIVDRARAQAARSGDRRPRLAPELERLEDEQRLLPLYLYDYAAWHAPDELPRLISGLSADGGIERDLGNLLLAKSKIADAEELERRAFAERLRPDADGLQQILFALATIQGDPLGYLAGRTEVAEILRGVSIAEVLQTTAQTQRLDAIALLRDILHADPDNAPARALAIEQELYWLKRIAQKLDGQAAKARSAFSLYLANRGFDPEGGNGWWPWMQDYLGAVWGLGPIAAFAGFPGIDLPGANAELVGTQLMAAARSRLAVTALIRLVRSGRTLPEIRALDGAGIAALLGDLWGGAAETNRRAVTRFAVDIHDSLRELRDLDRLSTDDGDTLEFALDVNAFFAADYFTPVDSRYQSFEWFGDLLNVHNLVTLWGPGAITRIDGRWATSGYMSFASQDALQKAGSTLAGASRSAVTRLIDNQHIVIAGYNLDTIGETVRRLRPVRLLARAHQAATRSIITGSALADLIGESSKLLAGFVLNGAFTELAKASGIPGAALITEIVLSYEVPGGLMDYLVHGAPATPLTGMMVPLTRYREQLLRTGDEPRGSAAPPAAA